MLAYSKENWDGESVGRTFVSLTANVRCAEYSDGGAIESALVNLDLHVTLSAHLGKRALEAENRFDEVTQHGVLQGCHL